MMVVILKLLFLGKGVRKGEELKAPHYTSAAIYDYITIHNIIPNTSNSSFVVTIYI